MFLRNLLILLSFVFSMNTVAQADVINSGGASPVSHSATKVEASDEPVTNIKPELTPAQQLKRMRHASPLPNLMRIALKNKEALGLDEMQIQNLEFWRNRQSLVAKRLVREIVKLESDIHTSSLSGKSTGYLINQVSELMGKRMKLASQKILCRDNMMHVLSPQQWAKVVELYKQSTQSKQT